MNSGAQANYCRLAMPQQLAVVLRTDASGPPLAREPVSAADLSDAVAETWRDQCLRRGHPERALADIAVTLVPLFPEGSAGPRCEGFALELDLPDGRIQRAANLVYAGFEPEAFAWLERQFEPANGLRVRETLRAYLHSDNYYRYIYSLPLRDREDVMVERAAGYAAGMLKLIDPPGETPRMPAEQGPPTFESAPANTHPK